MPLVAFITFPIALFLLVKGASVFLKGANSIGLALGIKPFVVGALIVAVGTSLPEVAISLAAVIGSSATTIPVAGAVGSNIVNILLAIGITALLVRTMEIRKVLIDVELPLLVSATVLFIFFAFDGVINTLEAIILCITFCIYLVYTLTAEDNRNFPATPQSILSQIREIPKDILLTVVGAVLIAVSAHFTIVSTISIAEFFNISDAIIAVTVLALGTSLPEIVVSIQSALKKDIEVVVGNIVGSNIFNLLFVVGLPALITNLPVSEETLSIGIPFLIAATLMFVVSGISNRIHIWEGFFYIVLYLVFVVQILGLV